MCCVQHERNPPSVFRKWGQTDRWPDIWGDTITTQLEVVGRGRDLRNLMYLGSKFKSILWCFKSLSNKLEGYTYMFTSQRKLILLDIISLLVIFPFFVELVNLAGNISLFLQVKPLCVANRLAKKYLTAQIYNMTQKNMILFRPQI